MSDTTPQIKHVITLMLENRSFDHLLGDGPSIGLQFDGVDPSKPGSNADGSGRLIHQSAIAAMRIKPDPKHELGNVRDQIKGGNAGFVLDYQKSYPGVGAAECEQIMGYFRWGSLPAIHALAEQFVVCDRWFSSVPGPTWANRLFIHSGTSLGRVEMPSWNRKWQLNTYTQKTIYDRLMERKISWRIYFGDIPQSLLLTRMRRRKCRERYCHMADFQEHVNRPESFPAYTFIEPRYFWPQQNDDHPPHSSVRAQRLIAEVYETIRNSALWESTLLVIVYDEHGGFYDRIVPTVAPAPDGHHEEYGFDRFGVRVPALLVSPWLPQGSKPTELDHTSILRFLSDKWGLGSLGQRVALAKSLPTDLLSAPRTDTPSSLGDHYFAQVTDADDAEETEELNENQQALLVLAEQLESETSAEARVAPETVGIMELAPESQVELAKLRVRAFLNQDRRPMGGGVV